MIYEFNSEITKSFYVRYVKEMYGLHKLIYKIALVLYILVLYLTHFLIEKECFWFTFVIICILIYRLILGSKLHALWEYNRFFRAHKETNIIQRTFYEDFIESSIDENKINIYYNKINRYIDSGEFLTLFTSKEKIIIEKESITDYANFLYFLESRINVKKTKFDKIRKHRKIIRAIKGIVIIFGALIISYVAYMNTVCKLIRYEIFKIEKYGIQVCLDDSSFDRIARYDISRWIKLSFAFTYCCKVNEVLENMPEGIFDEILNTKTYSNGMELHLYSYKTVTKSGDELSGVVIGGTEINYKNDKKIRIYLNTWAANKQLSFSHELYHLMEKYMEVNRPIKEFSNWESLNPDNFEYYDTYLDENGNKYGLYKTGEYIPTNEIDINNIYFINNYSKTYEYEDRAEIFSYLLATDKKESLPDYYDSKHIQEKAEVICKALRNHFKCLKGKEAYWEQRLHD